MGLALGAGTLQAQTLYTCKDAQGKTHTSDRPIPECSDRAVRILNHDGSTRREIPPPLTPEQRRQLERDEERKRQELALEREQARKDNALLTAYSRESDIENARKRSLVGTHDIIRASENRIKDIEAEKKKLVEELEFYKKRVAPVYLKIRIEDLNKAVASERRIIAKQQEELARINGRFDADLARYRDLSSGKVRVGQRMPEPEPAPAAAAAPAGGRSAAP
jgi:archaellum component FlaC